MTHQDSLFKAVTGVPFEPDPLSVESEEIDRESRGRLLFWMFVAITVELVLVGLWVFAVTTEII